MSKIGWPLAAVIAALVIAVAILGGALILGGDGDDDDGSEVATVTLPVQPTGMMEAGGEAATAPQGVDPDEADPDPDDQPLGKAEANRAGRAAVAAVGGGTVVEVDRSDDPGEAYEVEILTDRGEIDVALDHNLKRVPNAAYDDPYGD
ncbi:MAG: hypothetical protein F9K43_22435 [Bauldia sp.]|nr:MAG: hypothetical protein F9K43_22435 [Bauldia sp.]